MDIFDIVGAILGFIASIIPLIVIIFIFSRLAKAAKQSQKRSGGSNPWQQPAAQQEKPRLVKSLKNSSSGEYKAEDKQFSFGKSAFAGSRSTASSLKPEKVSRLSETFMKDDRKNDWLARQMREEEKILRRGDMLDLGASHAASCDADLLKRYHLFAEHDDSVDSGEY